MRLCLVSRELAPFWGAGIGTYTANMAAAWATAGHEVHVLCPRFPELADLGPRLPSGAFVHTVNPRLGPEDLASRPYEFQRYGMRVRRTLEDIHAATPFEYIEFPDYWAEGHEVVRARRLEGAFPGAVLCVRLHTPTHECRVLNDDPAPGTEVTALEREEDRTIRDADLILSPTRSLLDKVSQRLVLPPETPRRAVVPYPFDASALTSSPHHLITSSSPEVLYFGRLERRKGVDLLVRAAISLLGRGVVATFRFIGDDTRSGPGGTSMLAHLRFLIPANLRDRFIFEPARPREQLPEAVRAAAASGGVCCFPSLWENFPNACLEAMALGAPVVASDAGGMAEIIEPGHSGLLFKAGDAPSLEETLVRALADHALRARISEGGPPRIRDMCDPSGVVRDTLKHRSAAKSLVSTAPVGHRTGGRSTRALRIALVSREFAPFLGGGIGSYVSQTCAVLAAAGHEVHVITAPHENLLVNGPFLRPGVRFHCVDLDRGIAALDAYPAFPMRYAMAVHEALTRLSTHHRFDYIEFPDYHAEGYFAIRAKRTLGAYPDSVLAVRLHSPNWLCRDADAEPRLELEAAHIEHMERAAVAEADAVIAPARPVLERIALQPAPIAGLDHRPIHEIIPNPIDPADLARQLGFSSSPHPLISSSPHPSTNGSTSPTVLFFGKLQHLKGPQDLLTAAQLLLDRGARARFRFIGNDSPTGPFGRSMLEFLRSRIEPRFADSISFEPAVPRDRLGAAIRWAAESGGVCCFPSHWESFPNVCIEAMALSCPVIGADVGGLSAIIEHEKSGLLHPSGDAAALADAIERLLRDKPLRQSIAGAGPERIRALCNPDTVVGALEDLIARAGPASRPATAIEAKPAALKSTRPPVVPGLISHLATSNEAAEPDVSVLIPFFNLGRFLSATLDSLDRQTFRGFETIIINDGSTDPDSLALLESLARSRKGLRILHQPNRGLSATRNAALRAARARWVMPLDADDLIEPTLLAKAMTLAKAHPELTFISPLVSYFVDSPDSPTGGWVPLGPDRDLLVARNCAAAASGSLIRRDAMLGAGGYDESMTSYEDWDLWCRLAKSGARGTVIPEFLLHYRVRPDSMYRTEATTRHAALHAYILAQHPTLPINPGRALRLLASLGTSQQEARDGARALIAENIRYRVADKVNDALKATGLQQAIKGLTVRVIGPRKKSPM